MKAEIKISMLKDIYKRGIQTMFGRMYILFYNDGVTRPCIYDCLFKQIM